MGQSLMIPSSREVSKILKVDASSVPTFTPVMTKLLQICNEEESVAKDVAKLVETDIGISTRILGNVNSAFHGLRTKISSISEAILYLGIDEVKRIALSSTVFEKMIKPGRKKNFDRFYFWRHCLCVANISRSIAQEIGYKNPEEAYMAGLLHDYGKIIFDQQALVNYGDFLRTANICSEQLIDQERDIMGMGHDDIGVYYSVRWRLPDSVSLVVNYHHRRFAHLNLSLEENQLISIVSLANFLSWTQDIGSSDLKIPPILQPEVKDYLDFAKLNFYEILSNMDEGMEQTALFYNFSFPYTNQFRSNLLQANLKLGIINAKYHFNEYAAEAPHDSQSSCITSLDTSNHSLNPKTILMDTLQAICNDFGFDRICVMQATKPSRQLKVIECLTQEPDVKDLRGLCISIGEETKGFVYSLRNNLPVLVRDNLSAERKILNQFQTQEMIVVPFVNRTKVMGVLCMDYSISKKSITPEIFLRLSMVVNELGAALNNALTHRQVKKLSMYDPLSGLFNAAGIEPIIDKYFQEACNGKMELSIVLLSLDRFKDYHTQFDSDEIDNILRLIGKILQRISRPSDYIARCKENVFIAVLTHTKTENAIGFTKRISREVEEFGHVVADRFPSLTLSLSAGIAEYNKDIVDKQALISLAEKALAQANQGDLTQIVCADNLANH